MTFCLPCVQRTMKNHHLRLVEKFNIITIMYERLKFQFHYYYNNKIHCNHAQWFFFFFKPSSLYSKTTIERICTFFGAHIRLQHDVDRFETIVCAIVISKRFSYVSPYPDGPHTKIENISVRSIERVVLKKKKDRYVQQKNVQQRLKFMFNNNDPYDNYSRIYELLALM